jgi:hypothetical protein
MPKDTTPPNILAMREVFSINEFLIRYNVSLTHFYKLVNTGQLVVRKDGVKRVVILKEDAERWAKGLPAVPPKHLAPSSPEEAVEALAV